MNYGREGTARLAVHRMLALPYSYTFEHSFCSPLKSKHHFTVDDYKNIGRDFMLTISRYFCRYHEPIEDIFKELHTNKELMEIGSKEDK
jgi:hypothetical protein